VGRAKEGKGMAVWVVTGTTGFLGRHVLEALRSDNRGDSARDRTVIALGRRRPPGVLEHRFIEGDLADAASVRRAVSRIAPDYVLHTAGRTPPAPDDELYRANFWATVHLLSALRSLARPMRIVLLGSAAELGRLAPAGLAVSEEHACWPVDAYGRSKHLASQSGLAERPPMEVMVARVFNAIGPGLSPTQALGHFAARLAEPGPDPVGLTVGDLDARRDFVDARDVAQAMIALALRGSLGRVYNVGTGQSRRVGDGLEILSRLSGRSVTASVDPERKSQRGPADSCAAIGRIVTETGWRPVVTWEQSLEDLWREAYERRTSNPWSESSRSATAALAASQRLPLTA
jgi:GDP-4-dehydro-6-deoxy-D-mannose reductase